jgi:Asp-tRNA(Asn)/Glu-tRNA(Gln) amidotransferase A subunit family amidase
MTVFGAHIMSNIARATGGALPDRDLVEPLTYAIAERARSLSAAEFIVTVHGLHREARRIAAFFGRHDVWLTPTLAQPPLPIGHFDIESSDVDAWIAQLAGFIPFTYPFNVTGPAGDVGAAVVERRRPADRLPVRRPLRRRGDLFRLAAQLEQARPWFDRRPALAPLDTR